MRPVPALLAVALVAAVAGCGGSQRKATAPSLAVLVKRDFRQLHQLARTSPRVRSSRAGLAAQADLAALRAYHPRTAAEARAKPDFIRVFELGLSEMHDLEALHGSSRSVETKAFRRVSRTSELELASLRRGARALGITASSLGTPSRQIVHEGGWTGYAGTTSSNP